MAMDPALNSYADWMVNANADVVGRQFTRDVDQFAMDLQRVMEQNEFSLRQVFEALALE